VVRQTLKRKKGGEAKKNGTIQVLKRLAKKTPSKRLPTNPGIRAAG